MRIAADAVLRPVAQLDELEDAVDPRTCAVTVVVGEQLQVLSPREIGVEARAFDEAGDSVECTNTVHERVSAEELRGAGRRPDQAEQDPQQGRLARAVRPEVSEHVATLDREVDAVHCGDVAVTLDEPRRRDRKTLAHLSARAADSAAAGGSEPARTNETPFRCHSIAVPSCVASSCPVSPSSDTDGRADIGPLC